MKNYIYILLLLPFTLFANDKKIPSKIKEVTVYLSGAHVTRSSSFNLDAGTTELKFIGLSSKVDENSIQISGLQSVSILSIDYGINYLDSFMVLPEASKVQDQIKELTSKIALLNNRISGLQEEELLITTNRSISATNESLNLEKLKQISRYYRERITAIKNEVFNINLEINIQNAEIRELRLQQEELTKGPAIAQGELSVKFDAPMATSLNLMISYLVTDAGWVPTYDIKSEALNSNIQLKYKANVYQNTGADWQHVKINLSTGNPIQQTTTKPNIEAQYLNFVNANWYKPTAVQKSKYYYNPAVKKVIGRVTDASGQPLPGCNVVIKGTNSGTQTDWDGNYSLVITTGQELEFSYIGYTSSETPIYASIINTRMEENHAQLDEVVVVGYGRSNALSGKVAGIQTKGAPSVAQELPLYVIDGVPMPNFEEGDIDAADIQTMEILKNENATAVYGNNASAGVILITTKKSKTENDVTHTLFAIKKPYSIASDGDIISLEINTFTLDADYEYLAIPVINENVFLTASFKDWEQFNLLPGEANIYFKGGFAGKTVLDPYTTAKEMTISLGIDAGITVTRKQDRNFKDKSFLGNNRILNRAYDLEIKNNKNTSVSITLMDRIPLSENKEIKVSEIETYAAEYNAKNGVLRWSLNLKNKETQKERFSYQVKYPRNKYISL